MGSRTRCTNRVSVSCFYRNNPQVAHTNCFSVKKHYGVLSFSEDKHAIRVVFLCCCSICAGRMQRLIDKICCPNIKFAYIFNNRSKPLCSAQVLSLCICEKGIYYYRFINTCKLYTNIIAEKYSVQENLTDTTRCWN